MKRWYIIYIDLELLWKAAIEILVLSLSISAVDAKYQGPCIVSNEKYVTAAISAYPKRS